ncbi:MAG: matrixin family metalloprotease [Candidatus Gottesmanbacteria bacterium]
MRKIFDLIILGCLFLFLFWQKDSILYNFRFLTSSPCDFPITYRLGEIDSGYNLTSDQFLADLNEANQVWSSVVNKNLFSFEQKGKIIINLIYSDRQSMADNLNRIEDDLKGNKQSIDSLKNDYNQAKADFEKKLAAFNQEVAYWNGQHGAPQDVYDRLMAEQSQLKSEADQLNNLARQLNLSVSEYNSQVGQFNQDLGTFKQAIAAKPEAGLYDSSVPKIDIYLTDSNRELIHTLAHEMGHALGLPHIDNPDAIMYPWTNEIIEPTSEESTSLRTYCRNTNFELRLNQVLKNFNKSAK